MISVIIPTFNRSAFLKKAIESVLSQGYQDLELIVVDDGSEDDTPEVVANFDFGIRYIKQKNKGPGAARNLGIKNSKGEFIAFLDSDDWWEKDKLGIQFKAMQENPEYAISHTEEAWYRNGELLNQKQKHKKHQGYIFDKCLPICAVSMSTVMARREIFNEVGLFDEELPCCEDYDFWLRVSIGHKLLLVDKPLTLKDGGRPDQVSSIYATGMDRFRIQSILNLLHSGASSPEQRELATSELRKKCRIYGNGCIKHGRLEEGRHYISLISHF